MLSVPLKRRKPTTWFVNSMSDLFHEDLPSANVFSVFQIMGLHSCKQHTFQILTKRSRHMLEIITAMSEWKPQTQDEWPLPNVWLGVSVESRDYLSRIEDLRKTPAAVRFLSLEPLLEDLGQLDLNGIHWVIVGGESGPGARPMHPNWARGIRDQCTAAGVPFFFKQHGEWISRNVLHSDDWPLRECYLHPEQGVITARLDDSERMRLNSEGMLVMSHISKKSAGRILDGRTWDEMPRSGAQRF